jgi:hypothetical protein
VRLIQAVATAKALLESLAVHYDIYWNEWSNHLGRWTSIVQQAGAQLNSITFHEDKPARLAGLLHLHWTKVVSS